MLSVKHNIGISNHCFKCFGWCIIFMVVLMKEKFHDKYKRVGLNIAYYRKLSGLTQEQLAERLGVDRTTVSKAELALVGVSLDLLFEMAEIFGISPDKLLEIR